MKKRTISKLKSLFGGKAKLKRQLHQPGYGSRPASRSPSPPLDSYRALTPSPPPPPTRSVPPSPPVPTHPVAPTTPEQAGPQPLHPCAVCGRTFLSQSLAKHTKICEKMAAKKRKTFDSSRQRREGTDLASFLPKNFGLPENSPFIEKSPPNTAKAAPAKKTLSVRSAKAKPTPELSRCPHCGRAFGQRAFERHVEWCADKAKILPAAPAHPPQHVAEARHRLAVRTQYKAPLARSRRSLTRDKGSNSRSTSVESTSVRGESPPPPPPPHPPREAGDFRYRSRLSEGGSSAEYHEDAHSPHVPVIRRNNRATAVDQVGETARSRQARLAKDLNSNGVSDDYDPFASAARQMRELMSSDTNIPKKLQSTPKDSTKTLPYIRSNKEKSPPYHSRSNYSKTMKDPINKQTQNTPNLHRMRSFDNTNDYNSVNMFGGRSTSFRVNKIDTKSSPKINTTFTKSSKENINTIGKSPFSRTSSLNRSFSSYTSNYSTNKNKDKPVSMTSSFNHSMQRTVKPNKLEKITKTPVKKDFVNLDVILVDDSSSTTTDSHYIDPRLINENDNLPINVNTILNNPGIISSMESLLNTENLPSKFESFKVHDNNYAHDNKDKNDNNLLGSETNSKIDINKSKSNTSLTTPSINDLSVQYDKIMTSLEQSIASKVSVRDDDSLCEDFDLEEFMTSFDEELNKQKAEKRSYSSTTRVVNNFNMSSSYGTSENSINSSPKIITGNGLIPFNKSNSMTFSNNKITESVFPSSVKRSTSLLDTIPKKGTTLKSEGKKSKGYKTEEARLEQDIMQSLKEFDQFYENDPVVEDWMGNKMEPRSYSRRISEKDDTIKKESRSKGTKLKYENDNNLRNNNGSSNGKISNDSAYSSLNGISPSKLTNCNAKEQQTKSETVITPPPIGSDSSGGHKEELRAMSSDEFLALERSAEVLDAPLEKLRHDKEIESYKMDLEKRVSGGRRTPTWRSRADLSSSGSECSLPSAPRAAPPPPAHARLSRFCHECGGKFHIQTAKFCTDCGAKRLSV